MEADEDLQTHLLPGLTCVQQDPSQVSQEHVLVRMARRPAQVHGLLDQRQSITMVTLQIQDGGQVAHQHQGLTGETRVRM